MKHILVIDDNTEIRQVLKEMLEMEEYQVSLAEDGAKALALCDDTSFDLIITDICMPGKSGLEVIEELRKRSADQKIIAISGGPGTANAGGWTIYDEMLETAGTSGADKTLAKPFDRTAILETISELIAT
ncbi:MAG: response regulator [Candidatus Hydrogenedentota bacterium]|nr:MAG: response regulator [Candidatus Hydrogenedentota bacterium]